MAKCVLPVLVGPRIAATFLFVSDAARGGVAKPVIHAIEAKLLTGSSRPFHFRTIGPRDRFRKALLLSFQIR